MKTTGPVNQRSAKLAAKTWWGVLILTAVVTAITFKIQPQVKENFMTWLWGFIFPLLAVAGLAGVRFEMVKRDERRSFFASCAYLAGMLTSVVFGLYPLVLPARNPVYSLTVASAKAGDYGLKVGAVWWTIGILLVAGYFTYVYRSFAGKVVVGKGHGYH
jgi:cytochrome d ubiquinol oxidase subunit II